mmetsp:Transcript_4243/g.9186  ORF Transcript_4243/g.9186 Transcript_4243/m.9186 type:complete len:112 (-) Transcript_4243:735-1070(-)
MVSTGAESCGLAKDLANASGVEALKDNTADAKATTTTRADDADVDDDDDAVVRWLRCDFFAVVVCAATTRVTDIMTWEDIRESSCEAHPPEASAARWFSMSKTRWRRDTDE